jgi:hypothetical protein
MLPTRSTMVARASAGAFGLAAGLSLWNGTTEWTASFRGLLAAVACAILVPPIYGPVERAWANAQQNPAPAPAAPAAAPKSGSARP